MCLVGSSISRNRGLSNRYQQATDFGHHGKRDQEVGEKRTYSLLSADCLPRIFAPDLEIVCVKSLKDAEKLFVAPVDFGAQDRRIQG
jgi:hypothetical protein